MRRVALVTLLAFGCATARPPEPPVVAAPAPRVALAEPELELWLEGTHPVDPRESEASLARARMALSAAVEGRALDAPDPEVLLLVRARAIARTDERKSAQTWTVVFIVFVVVAIIVSTLLFHSHSAPRATPATPGHAALPPGTPHPPRPPGPAFVPAYAPPPPIGVGVGFTVWVPSEPLPPPGWVEPTEAWLAARGWWDSDATDVTVELADPRTGAVSWRRTVRGSVDPRDAGAVSALLDQALEGQPFGARRRPLGEDRGSVPVAPPEAYGPPPGDAAPPPAEPPVELPPPPGSPPPPPPGGPLPAPPAR